MGSRGETNQSDASPRIVNGITFREREKISLRDVWLYGILSLPDIFVSLFVLAVVGVHWLLRRADRNGKR